MLVSHFLLSLRGLSADSDTTPSPQVSAFTTVAFRIPDNVVGNLGESLVGPSGDVESDESGIEMAEFLRGMRTVALSGPTGRRSTVSRETESTSTA